MSHTERSSTIVTAANVTVPVPIPGTERSYTLKAPSWGAYGEMMARIESELSPSDAILIEALRDAVEASDIASERREQYFYALDEFEEAADHASSVYAASGTNPSAWSDEVRREVLDAEQAFRAAKRKRERVEWAMREHEAPRRIYAHKEDFRRDAQRALVALCLGVSEKEVAAMPAGDTAVLHGVAERLVRPDLVTEKN